MDERRLEAKLTVLRGKLSQALFLAHTIDQVLSHYIDWVIRNIGPANVAIWLNHETEIAGPDVYFGYGIKMTPTLRMGFGKTIVQRLLDVRTEEGLIFCKASSFPPQLRCIEGNNIFAFQCQYATSPIAAVIIFRRPRGGPAFTEYHKTVLIAGECILSAGIAGYPEALKPPGSPQKKSKKNTKNDADWWKRGEPPPF